MREVAGTVILILLIIAVATPLAEAKSRGQPALSYLSLHNQEAPICAFSARGAKTTEEMYFFSTTDTCAELKAGTTFFESTLFDFYEIKRDQNMRIITEHEQQYPIITAVGEYPYEYNKKKALLYTDLVDITQPPSESFVIQEASMCAEFMKMTFRTLTNSPEDVWEDFHVDPDAEAYRSCAKIYDHIQGFEDVTHTRGPSNYDTKKAFQGWALAADEPTTNTYHMPLYCSQVGIKIIEGEHGDWEKQKGELIIYDEATHGSHIQLGDGDNNILRFYPTFEESILTDFTIEITDEGSADAGGARYQVWCIDPIDIDSDKQLCEEQGGSFAQGYGCCLEATQAKTVDGTYRSCINAGTDDRQELGCYNEQSASYYCWASAETQWCGTDDQGERLVNDPQGYCCIQGSDADGKPHLWPQESGQPLFCEQSDLIVDKQEGIYAHDEIWRECNEQNNEQAFGAYLCTDQQGSYEWYESTCTATNQQCGEIPGITGWYRIPENAWTQDASTPGACNPEQQVDGTCCYSGVYAFGESLHAGSATMITKACMNGQIISAQGSSYFDSLGQFTQHLIHVTIEAIKPEESNE